MRLRTHTHYCFVSFALFCLAATTLAQSSPGVSFQAAVNYAVGAGPSSIAVGDFNGDGKLDLVVLAGPVGISVLLGNGDGTFQAPLNIAVSNESPTSLAVGDFNGDGKLDLAVTDGEYDAVHVLLGNGDGTFRVSGSYPIGSEPMSITVGDFNRDGKLDLAVAACGFGPSGCVSVLLGNGDGTFGPAVSIPLQANFWAASFAMGDFNGDGKPDLAIGNADTADIAVLLGNGDGTFRTPAYYPTAYLPASVTVGDFNGDGKLDLAAAAQNYISVLLGNGDGTFQTAVNYAVGPGNEIYGGAVTVGDFNGDGELDLVVTNEDSTGQIHTVSVLLGNGDGTFQEPVSYSVGNRPDSVAVGDFNGDGKPDLAVANSCGNDPTCQSNGTISVLLNTTKPAVTLSSATLMFTGQLVGTASSAQSVTLSNIGSVALTISRIGISDDFSQTNDCGSSVSASGSCTITVTFTPRVGGPLSGTLTITDNNDGAAGSTQTVSLSGTGEDFTLAPPSGSSTSQSVSPGQTATYTLSVSGEGGFAQTVAFTCAGAPSESTCTVSPTSATPGNNITVTVTTTAPSIATPRNFPSLKPPLAAPIGAMVLALLFAVGWMIWRGRRRIVLPLAVGILLTLLVIACGGGGGGGGGGGSSNPGTPAGTYTVTVTGTAGSGSAALSHSVSLTLTVT
jgi:hypothetical protein